MDTPQSLYRRGWRSGSIKRRQAHRLGHDEAVAHILEGHEFLLFARRAGIDAIRDQPAHDQPAHLVAPVACLLQSDIWVHAERNPLLLAGEAILETPIKTAGRRDLQIKAAAVEQADGFLLSGGILNFRG